MFSFGAAPDKMYDIEYEKVGRKRKLDINPNYQGQGGRA
jgi:hypothetical protein